MNNNPYFKIYARIPVFDVRIKLHLDFQHISNSWRYNEKISEYPIPYLSTLSKASLRFASINRFNLFFPFLMCRTANLPLNSTCTPPILAISRNSPRQFELVNWSAASAQCFDLHNIIHVCNMAQEDNKLPHSLYSAKVSF